MSIPPQIDAEFTHTGVEARFRARAPREVRIVAVAVAMGVLLPLLPVLTLVGTGVFRPDLVSGVFGPVMFGMMVILGLQCTLMPLLIGWAGKPAEVVLHLDERELRWEREGERTRFQLQRILEVEALSGEIRVEDDAAIHRIPTAGLKRPAVDWLVAHIEEARSRRTGQMEETAADRMERRRLTKLVENG